MVILGTAASGAAASAVVGGQAPTEVTSDVFVFPNVSVTAAAEVSGIFVWIGNRECQNTSICVQPLTSRPKLAAV